MIHAVTTRELDGIDQRILGVLQLSGRATFQQLADVVGLSARPCLERVRRLERERVIIGYTTDVNVSKLVNVVVVLARMFVKQGWEIRARFEQRMRGCPEVIECFEVCSGFNYVARIACPTLAHYRELIDSWINDPALRIERIESSVVLRLAKDSCVYPVELAAAGASRELRHSSFRQVDEIDLRILAALQRQGRSTFQRLSAQVGLSPRPCLERVRRLERDGIITRYRARIDVHRLASVVVAIVQLRVRQGREIRARFEQRMRSCPQVMECFEVSGTFDYVLRVVSSSVAACAELTESWINDTSLHVERVESSIVLRTPKDDGLYPIDSVLPKPGSLRPERPARSTYSPAPMALSA